MDLLSVHNTPETISAATRTIRDAILHGSDHIRDPNFDRIHDNDLAALFAAYDDKFFDGWLSRSVIAKTGTPLAFRLSSTMTRAGGKTIRTRIPLRAGGYQTRIEIVVASHLLFMTFRDVDRAVTVCGLSCEDRLQALQRIMEHETLHLAELLVRNKSSCAQRRFKSLAKNIFGHAGTKHDLVTPRERAQVTHDIRLGQHVEFEFAGVRRVGVVNRIHHRATVLVESRRGMRYSNGKRYEKFYMPLPLLKAVK